MKLLYVLSFLPPYITREIESLTELGHEIAVLLPEEKSNSETADFWSEISNEPAGRSVKLQRILKFKYLTCEPGKLLKPFFLSAEHFFIMIRSLMNAEFRYFLIASAAVREIPCQFPPDVIHAHFAHDQAHIARIMAAILKVPYTVTTHATDIFVPKSRTRLCRVLAGASRVFTISEYNLNYLKECRLLKKNPVVARVGLDIGKLPPRKIPEQPCAVCTASGLVSKKGVHVLIQAMKILHEKNIVFPLKVIGSDPAGLKLQMYRDMACGLPVEFTGALPSDEALEIVAGASFFVLPCTVALNGDRDGIPVALMEAMGMGVPCISTGISGIPELIENGISGFLVKPDSPPELAYAMDFLLSNRETAEEAGLAGMEKVAADYNSGKLGELLSAHFMQVQAEGAK